LAEGRRPENFTAGFDYNFGFSYYENLKKIFENNKPVQSIDTINIKDYANTTDGQGIVRYITNHDVNSSDGTPLDLFGGKEGSMAAFIVTAYMKGTPMIYNGQEVGTPYRLVFPFKKSKIDWSLNPDVTAAYKKILAFRNGSEAIKRGVLTAYSSDDVCVFTKTEGAEKVLVMVNLRNKPVTYAVPATLANTSWKDAFNSAETTLKNAVNLKPYAYLVLKN
jgi:glycosidase